VADMRPSSAEGIMKHENKLHRHYECYECSPPSHAHALWWHYHFHWKPFRLSDPDDCKYISSLHPFFHVSLWNMYRAWLSYSASKAALHSYRETLAVEFEWFNIRVMIAAPGSFATKFNAPTRSGAPVEGYEGLRN